MKAMKGHDAHHRTGERSHQNAKSRQVGMKRFVILEYNRRIGIRFIGSSEHQTRRVAKNAVAEGSYTTRA
ncbi:hypothetical protein EVAR_57767_1 [Eumeta japonica]|uniref:Uncharacterized protein n=1 Tax=Eumeta variegata TaxID=151549 RepID=A0A4C1Y671_EUMVA|nr:hypothetical protein EVAR_57767_1 [Eumeta japonica]